MNSDPKTVKDCGDNSRPIKERLDAVYSTESSAIDKTLVQLQSDALKTFNKD